MRKTLGTLTLLVIIVAVVGLNRDWFTIDREVEGDATEVHLHINREKIRIDTLEAAEAARGLRTRIEEKAETHESMSASVPDVNLNR